MATVKVRTASGEVSAGAFLSAFGADPGRTVYSTTAGMLACRHHSAGWCDDIKAAMETRSDSWSIWQDYQSHTVDTILVPFLPEDYFIFAKVGLELTDANLMKAYLLDPEWRGGSRAAGSGIFLGMLAEGDGRQQLRQMIFAWVAPNLDEPPRARCRSMLHNPQRHRQMRELFSISQKEAAAHVWCYRWYNKCLLCLMQEGVTPEFDPDLIPS